MTRLLVATLLFFAAPTLAQPVDDRGVELSAQLPAGRVVSLAPHLTELVYAIGAGGSLVGTVEHSDHPAAAADLPRVGDAFRVDLERIISMEPDLILAWAGGNPDLLIERLRDTGIPVFALEPSGLEDLILDIRTLGTLLGRSAEAAQLAGNLAERLDRLTVRSADPVPVFIQLSERPVYTVGGESSLSEIVRRCGGRNVFSDVGLASAVSPEAVAAANPEVLLLLAEPELAETWSAGWRDRGALSAGTRRLVVDPDLLSRPGPRVLEGMRQVCEGLARG